MSESKDKDKNKAKIESIIKQQLTLVKLLCPSFSSEKKENSLETISHLTKVINQNTLKLLNQKRGAQSLKSKEYQELESLLQKQQNKNRMFIKRELEVKQFQKQVLEQLVEQRQNHINLSIKFDQVVEQLRIKDVQILHLKNENKIMIRDKLTTAESHTKSGFIEKKVQQFLNRDFQEQKVKKKSRHMRRNSDDAWRKENAKNKMGSLTKR